MMCCDSYACVSISPCSRTVGAVDGEEPQADDVEIPGLLHLVHNQPRRPGKQRVGLHDQQRGAPVGAARGAHAPREEERQLLRGRVRRVAAVAGVVGAVGAELGAEGLGGLRARLCPCVCPRIWGWVGGFRGIYL